MFLLRELMFLLVTFLPLILAVPALLEFEPEKELEVQTTYENHPYGEDGLEKPEPNLNPFHGMFHIKFEKGQRSCTSPEDCNPGECCVVGMNRYSIPMCQLLGKTRDRCIMDNEKYTTELYYPRMKVVNVSDVYRAFCPCQQHLSCEYNECVERRQGGDRDDGNDGNRLPTYIDP